VQIKENEMASSKLKSQILNTYLFENDEFISGRCENGLILIPTGSLSPIRIFPGSFDC
jgi:hypothetical protein